MDFMEISRNRENGIVQISDIPTIAVQGSRHPHADLVSIWQGDITRLAANAIVNAANSQMLGCYVPMHTCIQDMYSGGFYPYRKALGRFPINHKQLVEQYLQYYCRVQAWQSW